MGAINRDYPESFASALRLAAELLGANHELVRRGTIDAEAEQIVVSAYQRAEGGKLLTRADLHRRIDDRFPAAAGEAVIVMAMGRAEGRLLQHLTQFQTFLNHDYQAGPEALVPRPETEILVARALDELRGTQPDLGIEVGLGSGVISLELLAGLSNLRMIASELSVPAAQLARRNAERVLGAEMERLEVVMATDVTQVWPPIAQSLAGRRADFLISNPPYLASPQETDPDVYAHEPHAALFAPPGDPLFFYREIAAKARVYLKPPHLIYLEIAPTRAYSIRELFTAQGFETEILPDLNGLDRVVIARGDKSWTG